MRRRDSCEAHDTRIPSGFHNSHCTVPYLYPPETGGGRHLCAAPHLYPAQGDVQSPLCQELCFAVVPGTIQLFDPTEMGRRRGGEEARRRGEKKGEKGREGERGEKWREVERKWRETGEKLERH